METSAQQIEIIKMPGSSLGRGTFLMANSISMTQEVPPFHLLTLFFYHIIGHINNSYTGQKLS